MPGYVIHLAVAKQYIKKHKNQIKDEEEFYKGVVYPDSVSDKSLTHYGEKSTKVILKKFFEEKDLKTDFNKGYFVHLITDYLFYNKFLDFFSKDIYNDYDITNKPLIDKYQVNITDDIKEKIFFKDGKTTVFSLENVINFIEKTSEYDINKIEQEVKNNNRFWNELKNLEKR